MASMKKPRTTDEIGEDPGFEFFPRSGSPHGWGGIYGEIVSSLFYPLQCGPSLVWQMLEVAQLVLGFLRGMYSLCS